MLKKCLTTGLLLAATFTSASSVAGGVVLSNTRVIYPAGQKQSSITVRNTSKDTRFMVQSWIEDAAGKKTSDFIATPPLYVSNPLSENSLRLMYAGPDLPKDKETIYYLTTRSVPAIDKDKMQNKNLLMFAAATRIKIFVRPAGLTPRPEDAPSKLTFSRSGKHVTVKNPTPYYVTITHIKSGNRDINGAVMVPPKGEADFVIPYEANTHLKYKSINDYGGMSNEFTWQM